MIPPENKQSTPSPKPYKKFAFEKNSIEEIPVITPTAKKTMMMNRLEVLLRIISRQPLFSLCFTSANLTNPFLPFSLD